MKKSRCALFCLGDKVVKMEPAVPDSRLTFRVTAFVRDAMFFTATAEYPEARELFWQLANFAMAGVFRGATWEWPGGDAPEKQGTGKAGR